MRISRRHALLGATATAALAIPLGRLFARQHRENPGRFGPLVSDPRGVLDLPRGFTYRIVQRAFDSMTDGYQVPACPDGMGCFAGPDGTLVLMRNHENTWLPTSGPCRLGQPPPKEAYDPGAQGAVTRVVLRADSLEVVSSNLVLAGTVRNCAGGRSPWGWLSCEESSDKGHGYVFLCRTELEHIASPERLHGYGQFRHEAAVVDPSTLIAHLTEDRDDGCLYRFVPAHREHPFEGRLQALAVRDRPRFDTSQGLAVGTTLDVTWVDLSPRRADDDTLRVEAHDRGAAVVKRGEGLWLSGRDLFVCSTTGGPRGAGQIFRLDLNGDRLALVAQSTDTGVLNMPDNITAAPWGEVFMAEDSLLERQMVRVLDTKGTVFDFARNSKSRSEIAGVCFSPDGTTLFLNLYGDGLTLAVRGPFTSQASAGAV